MDTPLIHRAMEISSELNATEDQTARVWAFVVSNFNGKSDDIVLSEFRHSLIASMESEKITKSNFRKVSPLLCSVLAYSYKPRKALKQDTYHKLLRLARKHHKPTQQEKVQNRKRVRRFRLKHSDEINQHRRELYRKHKNGRHSHDNDKSSDDTAKE